MAETSTARTEVGNYFVSNYPPFPQWKPEYIPEALAALNRPPRIDQPLGLYIHLPFCRKRCKFCYFKVYTDKNASDIQQYLNALTQENAIYSRMPALAGRPFRFVYFGGGTPSYISEKQLGLLVEGLHQHINWANAEEVTFECEPGTLNKAKLEKLKSIGVTRLSLGVEHFDDEILAANGRAHLSAEIYRAYEWAREVDFPQINIDLIAGMMGESDARWRETVGKAVALAPDSVTIYQMELPYNTVISREMKEKGLDSPIADWPMKRQWLAHAFEQFQAQGYRNVSAYTLSTTQKNCRFIYTDSLWHGGDMIGLGVSSFSHFDGVHFQNAPDFEQYLQRIESGELPHWRAYPLTADQRLIREMILLLKTGSIEIEYFQKKYGVDVWARFESIYEELSREAMLFRENGTVRLTGAGMLQVDHFLPRFFEPQFSAARSA